MENIKDSFQSRANAVKHNKGLTGLVRGMFGALAAIVGYTGCTGEGGGYEIPPGFHDNEEEAIAYIKDIIGESSYTPSEKVNAQFKNLDTGDYFNNEYDVLAIGPSGEEVYIEFNCLADGLTPEAEEGIESRTGTVPPLVVIGPYDSLEIIDQKLEEVL